MPNVNACQIIIAKPEMKKDNPENTFSNCNCKTEGLFVIAIILIMGSLLCFTLILVFDKGELDAVNSKSKIENPIERFHKHSKIITQPEESSFEK